MLLEQFRNLWSDKDREVWFSLAENHEKAYCFGLRQLRNCSSREAATADIGLEHGAGAVLVAGDAGAVEILKQGDGVFTGQAS